MLLLAGPTAACAPLARTLLPVRSCRPVSPRFAEHVCTFARVCVHWAVCTTPSQYGAELAAKRLRALVKYPLWVQADVFDVENESIMSKLIVPLARAWSGRF